MSSGHIKSAFAKSANEPKSGSSSSDSSFVIEDKAQRFTADILGQPTRHTAKRHSFSLSPGIERQDSVDAARFIPGAYPLGSEKKSVADPEQLPTSEHPSGSRIGVGSLPGNISESSVALLPEERVHPDPYLNSNAVPKGRLYRDESPLPLDGSELPTHEQPSGSRVGVGSLPGPNNEAGVVILPEERIHPDPYLSANTVPKGRLYRDEPPLPLDGSELPTHEHPSGSRVGVGSLPGPNNERGVAILPEERNHPDPIVGGVSGQHPKGGVIPKGKGPRHAHKKGFVTDKSELPTHEHPSGSRVGVGSLPGSNHEVGVAVLPEERLHPDPIVGAVGLAKFSQPKQKFYKKNKHIGSGRGQRGSQLPTHEEPSGSSVGIGSMPGDIHEAGVATLPEERVDGRPYGTMHTGFEEHLKEPSRKTKSRPTQRHTRHPSASKVHTRAQSKSKPQYELPTTEVPSTSRVGIGSMPGSIREAGVATLPEERIDGRPYGSGHTGFEDTLGHGHTFRPTHPSGGETAKSRSRSKSKSKSKSKTNPKHPNSKGKIIVDAAAKRYLMEHNPVSFASSHPERQTQPLESFFANVHPTSPTGEERLPGDTIFSATQRAKKKDPHFTIGELNLAPSVSWGKARGNNHNALMGKGELNMQARPEHTGPSVLETVEGVALEAVHGAENVLHRVEESAKAFIPEMHLPRFVGFGEHTSGEGKPDGAPERPQDTNATADRGQSLMGTTSHPLGESALPEDKDITDAATNYHTMPGRKSQFPPVIPREYHPKPAAKAPETNYDLFGDRVDFSEFIYDDDTSYEAPSIASTAPGDEQQAVRPFGDETSPSAWMGEENKDNNIQYGRNGVGFTMAPGKDGVLPGYPTQDGLNRLIGERMREDHLRATGAKNPFKTQTQKSQSTKAVQGPLTGNITSDDGFDPYAISDRHPRERRETPIFAGGQPTAADKYEAIFRDEPAEESSESGGPIEADISRRNVREKREVPIFKGGKATASGEYEDIFREKELLPAQFDESRRHLREMKETPIIKSGHPTAAATMHDAAYPDDSDISGRNIREKPEIPIFMSKKPTGEYEAVFQDGSYGAAKSNAQHHQEKERVPVFEGGGPTASGKYEAIYRDEPGSPIARNPKANANPLKNGNTGASTRSSDLVPHTQTQQKVGSRMTTSSKATGAGAAGIKVGYLGKAVSPEEEAIEIERARRAAVRRMGID